MLSTAYAKFFTEVADKVDLQIVRIPDSNETFLGYMTMAENQERRREQRLRYHWPIWFAEDFNGILSQGQMVDVSSLGAAFTCHSHERCPSPGQHLTARFSVPHFGTEDSFDMANFTRDACVCRVEQVNSIINRISLQFSEPLPFKPGEQDNSSEAMQQSLDAVAV